MFRNKILLKSIAAFLILNLSIEVFAPSLMYALTSGPTAPEYNTFEPFDITDMVNLQTGDFTYSMPLMEVPGPEGGYPVSLSYHAGILLNQDASWVGLGWNLNPGAINRTVDGYADDVQSGERSTRDYWGGASGSSTAYNVGLSIPIGGISSIYLGLSVVKDSYKGISTGSNFGFGYRSLQMSTGTSGSNIGLDFTSSTYNISKVSLGISFDENDKISFYAGQSVSGNRPNPKGRVTVLSSLVRSQSSQIGGFLSLNVSTNSYKYRYYSDQRSSIYTYGALYPTQAQSYINSADKSYDSYPLLDPDETSNTINTADPNLVLGGSFPAYDRYDVSAQGLGGTMQPYIFENGTLYRSNIYEPTSSGTPPVLVQFKSARNFSTSKVDFRFNYDFSNALSLTPGDITFASDLTSASAASHTLSVNSDGFNNSSRQHLAGSKHIEWFTVAEIRNGTATSKGFMDYYAARTDRANTINVYEDYLQSNMGMPYECGTLGTNPPQTICYRKSLKPTAVNIDNQIGGYSITNASGVTYHYALPVYNFNEYQKTELKNPKDGAATYREEYNKTPYAYTWLLTAITGPDYVDKNANGIADDQDWGYWVKFEYGKWTDSYQWRNPLVGKHEDANGDYTMFSYGIKELYYLDAIKTRTHTAIFMKSIRRDGLGTTNRETGESKPRRFKVEPFLDEGNTNGPYIVFNVSPVATLKLDDIYLLKNEDLASISFNKATGTKYTEGPFTYGYSNIGGYTMTSPRGPMDYYDPADVITVKYHYGDNVYDDGDLTTTLKNELTSKSLKIVKLNTDFSLCNGTPNSIWNNCTATGQYAPDYAYSDDFTCYSSFGAGDPCDETTESGYIQRKNRLYFYQADPFYYFNRSCPASGACCTTHSSPDDLYYNYKGKLTLKSVKILGKGGTDLIPGTNFTYSKNPNYLNGYYDNWGFYKSDYNATTNKYRATTNASSQNVDAWSLTSIETPLGSNINIEYESDQISNVELMRNHEFKVTSIQPHTATNQIKITCQSDMNLTEILAAGQTIELITVKSFEGTATQWYYVEDEGYYDQENFPYTFITGTFGDNVTITQVSNNYIIAQSETMYNHFNNILGTVGLADGEYYYNGGFNYAASLTNYPFTGSFPNKAISIAGKLRMKNNTQIYGGGIRTKKITVTDGANNYSTNYSYNFANSAISSGTTPYLPIPFDDGYFARPTGNGRPTYQARQGEYKQAALAGVSKLLAISRMVPSPGVFYEYVTVKESAGTNNVPVYNVYNFEVFHEDMVIRDAGAKVNGPAPTGKTSVKRTVKIKDYSSRLGNLKGVYTYNGDNKLISKTVNNYLHDNVDPATYESNLSTNYYNQGVVQQSFNEYRINDNGATHKAVVSVKEEYPSVLLSTETFDYQKGVISKNQNNKFDFYSGAVTESQYTNSSGVTLLSVVRPAYKEYTFSSPQYSGTLNTGMGLKVNNINNKNMLLQTCETYLYKVETPSNKLLSASVEPWHSLWYQRVHNASTELYESQQISDDVATVQDERVWRKHRTYTWNSPYINADGTFKTSGTGAFVSFNWATELAGNDQPSPYWNRTSEVTLYDKFSNILEAKEVNANYGATKFGYGNSEVLVTAVNARLPEIAYSGAEDLNSSALFGNTTHFGGEVWKLQGVQDATLAHTGKYSLKVTQNQYGFIFRNKIEAGGIELNKKYRASVWVYDNGNPDAKLYYHLQNSSRQNTATPNEGNVTIATANPVLRAGKWKLIVLDFTLTGSYSGYYLVLGCTNGSTMPAYFDDFRFHPFNTGITSYVYDTQTMLLTHILDKDGFYTRYEYDAMGRLIATYQETLQGEKKTSSQQYHYGRQ